MKIFLLTHERELHRKTNTGSLALDGANKIVERILWERVNPNKDLIRLIENHEAVLLYSKGESSSVILSETSSGPSSADSLEKIEGYENIIIIDATWQESQKIFNQSVYLKNALRVMLKTNIDSRYKLRANQPKGGLCTIECIIEVLKIKGRNKLASKLSLKFEHFNG